ncbi:MAG: YiiX/YebB-like N1pC/P60 family cysteine hydrolase [Syntrophomonadaceae bacterium]|nr:YiiX/YebB-like N1pC/P60 family cysteine hydrolase [Syntrophomonadaceae bacterium]
MNRHLRIWFFPIAGFILLVLIVVGNWSLMAKDSGSVIHVWVKSALAGQPGPGVISYAVHEMPDIELLPGDILLGGYLACSYGRYTHAALYVGEGEVIEAYMDLGVVQQSMNHFRNYDYYAILRPKVGDEVKTAAIQYAASKCGQLFYPLAFNRDERYWNCTKIIWKAYEVQGADMDPIGDLWLSPDAFKGSTLAEVLYER